MHLRLRTERDDVERVYVIAVINMNGKKLPLL
ncbi:hypothetical protein [Paenibacillus swuensis]